MNFDCLAGGRDVDADVALGLLHGLLAPVARDDVVDDRAGRRDVQRHGRELQRRAALQEQHFVIRGHAEQLAQVALRLRGELDEVRAAMADFHHGHAAAAPVEQLRLRTAQNRLRQHRRPRAEVEYTLHRDGSPYPTRASPSRRPAWPRRARCRRADPLSSKRISRTPCVLRLIVEMSATGVRIIVPVEVISMSSSSGETCSAPTSRPLRSDVWMQMTP